MTRMRSFAASTGGDGGEGVSAGFVSSAISTHNSDTTGVHGIDDTADLETQDGATAKVEAHEGDTDPHGDRAYTDTAVGNLTPAGIGAQPADADLTAIAALAPADDAVMQRKTGAWTARTPAQVKTDLSLAKTDVGLANVDNTADTAKPVSTAQQTALNAKAGILTVTAVKTTTYTAGPNELVQCNAAAGGFTITLPPASTAGQTVIVKRTEFGGNSITVARAGTDVIGTGAATSVSIVTTEGQQFVSDGAGVWMISHSSQSLTGLDVRYAQRGNNLSDLASVSTARTNLGLGTAAVTNTGTGAGNTILGNDSRLTDARTPNTHATSHGSGGSDPVTVAQSQVTDLTANLAAKLASSDADVSFTRLSEPGDILTVGQVVPRRSRLMSAVSQVSGTLVLTYFYADRSETISTLTVWTRNIAAAATPTLCRMGLYSVAGNGDLTLVASTPNDTALFGAVDTAYPKALSTPVAITRGTQYATALLVVTAATAPNFHGYQYLSTSPINTIVRLSPPMVGRVTSQTDLPSSVSAGSIVGYQASTGMQLS